ncbi:MAG: class I SAM-dependent methyltransferase [Phycicoccus sp.]|nr:class I SAM-dependent methyltransferase [Phycicoccus sp.]NMM33509.1 class I SAM-dependent methyltransferase [Phycicoccus sp.]
MIRRRADAGSTALPVDYDRDPERFAANQAATSRFCIAGDVHGPVAERLASTATPPVLDLGGGDGTLARLLVPLGMRTVVLDQAAYVERAPRPAVRADAHRLPFTEGSFGAVAALWMLYHLGDPLLALSDIARVLRPGGTFVACTSSRFNDPELASALPEWGRPFSFDAETAPTLVSNVFDVVEVQRWDAPMVTLPDQRAVGLFLRGRGLSPQQARQGAERFTTPLTVTKRGTLIWARRR